MNPHTKLISHDEWLQRCEQEEQRRSQEIQEKYAEAREEIACYVASCLNLGQDEATFSCDYFDPNRILRDKTVDLLQEICDDLREQGFSPVCYHYNKKSAYAYVVLKFDGGRPDDQTKSFWQWLKFWK